MVITPVPVAMEIENGLKLPVYSDTEILIDELTLSPTEFMSRFEKFKVDEISIDEAEVTFASMQKMRLTRHH